MHVFRCVAILDSTISKFLQVNVRDLSSYFQLNFLNKRRFTINICSIALFQFLIQRALFYILFELAKAFFFIKPDFFSLIHFFHSLSFKFDRLIWPLSKGNVL